jgi:hypothetical protein
LNDGTLSGYCNGSPIHPAFHPSGDDEVEVVAQILQSAVSPVCNRQIVLPARAAR